jgi:hypothetical protein
MIEWPEQTSELHMVISSNYYTSSLTLFPAAS